MFYRLFVPLLPRISQLWLGDGYRCVGTGQPMRESETRDGEMGVETSAPEVLGPGRQMKKRQARAFA